ncbi:hypothetical protein ACNKHN_01840 [Shigella flexneri]
MSWSSGSTFFKVTSCIIIMIVAGFGMVVGEWQRRATDGISNLWSNSSFFSNG